jgi:hypothetical protein
MENTQIIETASMLLALKHDTTTLNVCNIAKLNNNVNKPTLFLKHQCLILLRHASLCKNEDGQCGTTPYCTRIKLLWKHVKICKDIKCIYPDCISSRKVIAHYNKCEDQNCKICGPVQQLIRNKVDINDKVISGVSSTLRSPDPLEDNKIMYINDIQNLYNSYCAKIWKIVRIDMKNRIRESSFSDESVEMIEEELYQNANTLNSYKDPKTLNERLNKIIGKNPNRIQSCYGSCYSDEHSLRDNVVQYINNLLKLRPNYNSAMADKILSIALFIDKHLYKNAKSMAEYSDTKTIEHRINQMMLERINETKRHLETLDNDNNSKKQRQI